MNKQTKDCHTFIRKNSTRRWNTHKTFILANFVNSFNCLTFFLHSNQLFKTIIQSFSIAISQNTIRTRNRKSAGVLITSAGGGHPKIFENFFEKVSQC